MRQIGVLTSGGDCSGMNAAVRAVVRVAYEKGIAVTGFRRGYAGLLAGDAVALDNKAVANTIQRGGTFLQSARCEEFKGEAGFSAGVARLRESGVEALVVIGGDGSLRGARRLHEAGIATVAIPASIDNDIAGTEMALGVDTALNNIVFAIDCIKDTACSHARAFVVEVMGRDCGYLACMAAIASGAEFAIVPEREYDLPALVASLRARHAEGRDSAIIVVAEGAGRAQAIADTVSSAGFETRVTVLGHYQRGGAPSVFDRILASRFGSAAIDFLVQGRSGVMTALRNGEVVPLELGSAASHARPVEGLLDLPVILSA